MDTYEKYTVVTAHYSLVISKFYYLKLITVKYSFYHRYNLFKDIDSYFHFSQIFRFRRKCHNYIIVKKR